MNILYHLTPFENYYNIMKEGLIPGKGYGITAEHYKDEVKDFVWLTNDPIYIANTLIGKKFCRRNKVMNLTIDVTGLDVVPHVYTCYKEPVLSDWEFVTRNRIDVCKIIKTGYIYD